MYRFTFDPEQVLLRALSWEWSAMNKALLAGALKPPTIGLVDSRRRLGRWVRDTRSIELSRSLVMERPWGEVRDVLAHEMAHQYAHEVLGAVDETAHGQAFRRTCERMGVSSVARGTPQSLPESPDEPRVLRRIRKLLALAQSPNEHEARLAAARAQRLMLEHNLATVDEGRPQPYASRQLGPIKRRFQAHEKMLCGLLGEHFFVRCIWMNGFDVGKGRSGRYLEISGTPENLDMAAWVYEFLLDTGERLWRTHKREQGIAGNTDRRRYLAGVIYGFREQLEGQAQQNQEEGLIWLGDVGLQDYYETRHPSTRKVKGPRVRATGAWRDGKSAGRGIVMNRPVTGKPGRGGRRITGE
jgi:hypothetical protein